MTTDTKPTTKISAAAFANFASALCNLVDDGEREMVPLPQLSEREIGRQEGLDLALRWLRERASSHAGRWAAMAPREAIKALVQEWRSSVSTDSRTEPTDLPDAMISDLIKSVADATPAARDAIMRAHLGPAPTVATSDLTNARTTMTLGRDDLDRVRQWFEAVQDVSPAYLEPGDFELARGIYDKLGMRVPLSVLRGLA